jgi:hypothetical protein
MAVVPTPHVLVADAVMACGIRRRAIINARRHTAQQRNFLTLSAFVALTIFTLGYGARRWRASRTPLRHGAQVCVSNPFAAKRTGVRLEPCYGETYGSASRTRSHT